MERSNDMKLEPFAVSVSEAARLLGLSRPTVYQLMQQEHLPHFKVGTRTLIPVADLRVWVSERAKSNNH